MAITIQQAGHASGTTTTTSAYNQAAGNCILVIASGYSVSPALSASAPTDTAGNAGSFVQIFPAGDWTGANSAHLQAWYCLNCKGNAANVITVAGVSTNGGYGGIDVYDIAGVTGLDLAMVGGAASKVIKYSTAKANEAIVSLILNTNASITSTTPPVTTPAYTADAGILSGYTSGACKVVSSLQSWVTETWTADNANDSVFVFSFYSGSATSGTSFNVWQHQGTVLSGAEEPFLPNVIQEGGSQCGLGGGSVFKMWYSGAATNNTYYAESLDGKTNWVKYSGNPILTGQVLTKIFKYGGIYYLYSSPSTQDAINVYTCSDGTGINFSLAKANAIVPGAGGAWDNSKVVQLSVLDLVGGVWYGYYAGTTGGTNWKAGLATSSDLVTWNKVGSTPAISNNIQTDFHFQKVGSTYYGWTHATFAGIPGETITLPGDITRYSATSPSGPWTSLGTPTFYRTQSSEGITQSGVGAYTGYGQVADPFLISVAGTLYQYFTQSPNGNTAAVMTIGLAKAPSMTFAQLVLTNEGIQNIPCALGLSENLHTLASDAFSGADANPIGGNWSELLTYGGASFGTAQRLSHSLTSSAAASNSDSYWNALTWDNDQWAQVTITTCSAGAVIANLRGSLYCSYRVYYNAAGTIIAVQKFDFQGGSTLASTTWTLVSGNVLTAAVIGTSILVYVDGNLIINCVDTGAVGVPILGGAAGAGAYPPSTVTTTAITAFAAGDFLLLISGNAGVAGATVACTGQSSTTADASGNYSFIGLPNGSYTITPTPPTGYTFSPTSSVQTVSGADITGVNFTATQIFVATPTFSPIAGTYTSTQTVTILSTDSALAGFAMYYTTDGSTPTTGSTLYVAPVSISVTSTLKAIAVATGYANSAVGSAAYVINLTPLHYSVPDDRNYGNFPNLPVNVQGTLTYTTPSVYSLRYWFDTLFGRTQSLPLDSRISKPTDSRVAGTTPQNSRTPGTFGPGE